MKNTGRLKNIPVRIVHGELDFDCPMSMAWELAKKIPHADFTSVPYEGHGGPMQTELLSRGLKYF
jgi:pimeloyl-ACP methyl ester carboxylesterase